MAEGVRPRRVGGRKGRAAHRVGTHRRERGKGVPHGLRGRVWQVLKPWSGVASSGAGRNSLTWGHLDLQMRTLLKLHLVLEDQPGVGFEQGEALPTPGETQVARVAAAFHPKGRAERRPPLPAPRGLILTVDYIFMKTRSRVPHTSHL